MEVVPSVVGAAVVVVVVVRGVVVAGLKFNLQSYTIMFYRS